MGEIKTRAGRVHRTRSTPMTRQRLRALYTDDAVVHGARRREPRRAGGDRRLRHDVVQRVSGRQGHGRQRDHRAATGQCSSRRSRARTRRRSSADDGDIPATGKSVVGRGWRGDPRQGRQDRRGPPLLRQHGDPHAARARARERSYGVGRELSGIRGAASSRLSRSRPRGTSCTSCRSRTSRGRCGRSSPVSATTRCSVRGTATSSPSPLPPNAAEIASEPAIDSCEYARPPSIVGRLLRCEVGRRLGRELGVEEREDDLLADRAAELLEHRVAFLRVLDERVLLGHRPQVHALAQVVHALEVLAPARVDDLEDHVALELA